MSSKEKWSTYRPANGRKKRPRQDAVEDKPQDTLVIVGDVKTSIHDSVVEDTKVINYIKRLRPKSSTNVSSASSSVSLVVGVTEASYISNNDHQLCKDLREAFGISDIIVSKKTFNIVDKLVTVYGDITSVSRAVVFISFLLSSKLNNPVKCETFTLKSSNYSVSVLIPNTDPAVALSESGVKEWSVSKGSKVNNSSILLSLKSDFSSLFNFLTIVQSSGSGDNSYSEEQDILPSTISLDQNTANLYRNHERNKDLPQVQAREAFQHVFS